MLRLYCSWENNYEYLIFCACTMIILCTFLGELYLRNWKSGVYFWVKEAWPQSGMEWILDLDKANSCVVVGCDSWASEEGEGLAWRPLAEWPWTSEIWSSCVESSQVVLWADPPIRHHINTLFFRFFSHLIQLLVPNSSLIPSFFPSPTGLFHCTFQSKRRYVCFISMSSSVSTSGCCLLL